MKLKKLLSMLLATVMVLSLAACGNSEEEAAAPEENKEAEVSEEAAEDVIVIKLGHSIQEETSTHRALMIFEEEVEKNSEGRVDVQLFPNGALGTERTMTESVQMGTLEMTTPGSFIVATFDPTVDVLSLPYLFPDEEAARTALSGEFGEKVAANLGDVGLMNLAWLENGIRHISNTKHPINTPADMKDLKLRTVENQIQMDFFSIWGASPTPMAYSELFTALQQGTVDAQENSIFLIKTSRFEEVTDYLTLSAHSYCAVPILINKAFFDGLPSDIQTILKDAAVLCRDKQYEFCDEDNAAALEYLKGAMEVNEITPENRQLFIDAAAPVYEDAREKLGDELVDMALSFQN